MPSTAGEVSVRIVADMRDFTAKVSAASKGAAATVDAGMRANEATIKASLAKQTADYVRAGQSQVAAAQKASRDIVRAAADEGRERVRGAQATAAKVDREYKDSARAAVSEARRQAESLKRIAADEGRDLVAATRKAEAERTAIVKKEAAARAAAEKRSKEARSELGERALHGIGAVGNALTIGVTLPILYGANRATQEASKLAETMNVVQVVFGKNSAEVEKWSNTALKSFGIAKQEALAAAGNFGALFTSMKVAPPVAAAMSTSLVKVAGDLTSFYNVASTQEALDKLKSGIVGEVEPLRVLGVNLSEARVQAEAFASGIAKPTVNMDRLRAAQAAVTKASYDYAKAVKEHGVGSVQATTASARLEAAEARVGKALEGNKAQLTDAQKVMARYRIILQDSKIAHDDFAHTANSAANQERVLQGEIVELAGAIGKDLLPIKRELVKVARDVVHWFAELTPQQRETAIRFVAIAAAAGPALKLLEGGIAIFKTLRLAVVALKGVELAAWFTNIGNAAQAAGAKMAWMKNPAFLRAAGGAGLMALGQATNDPRGVIGGGLAGGALAGSQFGPLGAIIGGGVGAMVNMGIGVVRARQEANAAERAAQAAEDPITGFVAKAVRAKAERDAEAARQKAIDSALKASTGKGAAAVARQKEAAEAQAADAERKARENGERMAREEHRRNVAEIEQGLSDDLFKIRRERAVGEAARFEVDARSLKAKRDELLKARVDERRVEEWYNASLQAIQRERSTYYAKEAADAKEAARRAYEASPSGRLAEALRTAKAQLAGVSAGEGKTGVAALAEEYKGASPAAIRSLFEYRQQIEAVTKAKADAKKAEDDHREAVDRAKTRLDEARVAGMRLKATTDEERLAIDLYGVSLKNLPPDVRALTEETVKQTNANKALEESIKRAKEEEDRRTATTNRLKEATADVKARVVEWANASSGTLPGFRAFYDEAIARANVATKDLTVEQTAQISTQAKLNQAMTYLQGGYVSAATAAKAMKEASDTGTLSEATMDRVVRETNQALREQARAAASAAAAFRENMNPVLRGINEQLDYMKTSLGQMSSLYQVQRGIEDKDTKAAREQYEQAVATAHGVPYSATQPYVNNRLPRMTDPALDAYNRYQATLSGQAQRTAGGKGDFVFVHNGDVHNASDQKQLARTASDAYTMAETYQ